jgi:hypothetical protein
MIVIEPHGHHRADMVTRTGVVEPYYVRQVSPVVSAQQALVPFIASVRGRAMTASPAGGSRTQFGFVQSPWGPWVR